MASQEKSRNYYAILHVSRDAPVEIIRSSYRTLMQRLKNHPDLGGDAATAALINQAYAALTDIKRRAEYDASLDAARQPGAGRTGGTQETHPTRTPDRTLDPSHECVFCKTPHEHGNVIHAEAECTVCGSPLYPDERRRFETTGKRAVARISKRQDITFYTHWPQSQGFAGRTEDISLNGMRFVTNENLSEVQYIKIVGRVVEAVGEVRHCSKRRCGETVCSVAGVSFVTIRFARSIGAFVSHRV